MVAERKRRIEWVEENEETNKKWQQSKEEYLSCTSKRVADRRLGFLATEDRRLGLLTTEDQREAMQKLSKMKSPFLLRVSVPCPYSSAKANS